MRRRRGSPTPRGQPTPGQPVSGKPAQGRRRFFLFGPRRTHSQPSPVPPTPASTHGTTKRRMVTPSEAALKRRRVGRRVAGWGLFATLAAAISAWVWLSRPIPSLESHLRGQKPTATSHSLGPGFEMDSNETTRFGGIKIESEVRPLVPEELKQAFTGMPTLDARKYPGRGTQFGKENLEALGFDLRNPSLSNNNRTVKQPDIFAHLASKQEAVGVKIVMNVQDLKLTNTKGESINEYDLYALYNGGQILYEIGGKLYTSGFLDFVRTRRSVVSHVYEK